MMPTVDIAEYMQWQTPVAVEDLAVEIAERAWSEANQIRNDRGQFAGTTGGGGGGSGAGAAIDKMLAGEAVTITLDQLPDVMASLQDHPAFDLQLLSVSGEGNENLFATHLTDIPRSGMPQLPTSPEGLAAFQATMSSRGVKLSRESVDPRTLKSTQTELNSVKVGSVYAYTAVGGGLREERGILVVSKEGGVIDGHHRYAAMAAYAVHHPETRVNVLRIDADAHTVIAAVREFSTGPRDFH